MSEIKTMNQSPSTTSTPAQTPSKKKAPGLTFRRFFTKPGVSPYDEVEWELRTRPDHRRPGQRDLRAERRRSPQRLVHDRHQHRRQQISARHARHSRARNRRPPARHPRRRNHSRLGYGPGLLPHPRRRRHLPRRTRPHPGSPVRGLQLARLVQRRMRSHRAQLRRPELALESRRRSTSNSASPDTSKPQCSACFINSVQDSLDSILTLAKTEGMLFKWGSAPAPTSRRCAAPPKRSPAEAPPAARSAS